MMWSNFFRDGGFGMYPTLIFGFALVAAAAMYLLRPERRRVALPVCLGLLTLGSGLLGFTTGMVNTLRYIQKVPPGEQLQIGALGAAESANNLVLALIFVVLAALLASIGAFRASRAPATAA